MSELVASDFEDGVLHVTLLRHEKRNALSNALIAAIETNRKAGSVSTWKKLGAALNVSWEQLA